MSATIYLIRHGETDWSVSGKHTGHSNILLTENGVNKAKELGKYLQGMPFSYVFTSPLKRAQQTCELVGLRPIAEVEPDLVEWNYGDYEGQTSAQICSQYPNWNIYRDGCPSGEMPTQVSARADRLIARLLNLDGNIALFSHGQISRVIATRWIGLSLLEAQHFTLDTASVSILTFDPHHPKVPVITLWNATLHKMINAELLSILGTWENSVVT